MAITAKIAAMPHDSSVQTAPEEQAIIETLRVQHDAAWRKTFAAAQRVMDHHRANLEAHLTIRRLRRDKQRGDIGPAAPPDGR